MPNLVAGLRLRRSLAKMSSDRRVTLLGVVTMAGLTAAAGRLTLPLLTGGPRALGAHVGRLAYSDHRVDACVHRGGRRIARGAPLAGRLSWRWLLAASRTRGRRSAPA
jgi:hypothetical protein